MQAGARTESAGTPILKYEQGASPNGASANSNGFTSPTDARGGGLSPEEAAHQALPHVFADETNTQRLQARPSDSESQIHPSLRSFHEGTSYAPVPNMNTAGIPQQPEQPGQPGPSVPMMAAPAVGATPVEDGPDGRKKRELSTSKRAAQNRAAQRAFRQRKEGYIKKLETQVRDYTDLENQYKAIQSENYSLREYIIHLQSRIIDAKGEVPQPPPNVQLANPHVHGVQPSQHAQGLGLSAEAGADSAMPPPTHPLAQVAQAVGGHLSENRDDLKYEAVANDVVRGNGQEEARAAEEIARQLQADGLPTGS